MPPLLYLIALGNLVVGSSAFVISGLIDLVARGLGTSVAAAGQAMTVYALATALLAPLLVVAIGRWPARRALLLALVLFTLGNGMCALSASLPQLLAGRLIMGLGSMFTPIGAGVAIAAVSPDKRGMALATAFIGMSLSYVVGVPLGTWIGQHHGWPAALWLMTAASAATLLVAAWRLPARLNAPGASFAGIGGVLRRPDVLAGLATTLLYFSAIFMVFSYIAPVYAALMPQGGLGLSWTLTLFGLAGVAGTLVGGFATDRFGAERSLRVQLLTLAAMMMLLPLSAGHYPALIAVLLGWGGAGFGAMTPQQSRLAQMAPLQAPLLLSLNASMLYLGMALGAAIGGPAAAWAGFDRLPWVAAPFAVVAALLLQVGRPRGGGRLVLPGSAPS